ncbi:MAG: 50S ribosomal protein L11 methyltransferase [Gaiellaceae bacterium]
MSNDRAEEGRAVMLDLFPEGFEEVEKDGGLELAAYTTAGGEERLWQVFGPGRVTEVEPDWAERWKQFHRPARVGRLWLGPPWEKPDTAAISVVIDPGRAFGTGSHPTTQVCLEHLLELEPGSVLDLGCGSGVLAIAAARLGFAPVTALDFDEAAVEATQVNTAANGVEISVARADVLSDELPGAAVAVANIALDLRERVGSRWTYRHLVTSGYLESESPELPGWRHSARKVRGGWAADRFERH